PPRHGGLHWPVGWSFHEDARQQPSVMRPMTIAPVYERPPKRASGSALPRRTYEPRHAAMKAGATGETHTAGVLCTSMPMWSMAAPPIAALTACSLGGAVYATTSSGVSHCIRCTSCSPRSSRWRAFPIQDLDLRERSRLLVEQEHRTET